MHKSQYKKLGFQSIHDLESFLDSDEIKTLIGKNYDHYRAYYLAGYEHKVMGEAKKKVRGSFNWLALTLGLVWFSYRKMYVFVFSISLVFALISFAEKYYDMEAGAGSTPIVVWLIFALYSKDWYLGGLVKRKNKIQNFTNHERAERYLKRHSGVSVVAAFLSLPFLFAMMYISIILAEYLKTGAVTF